MKTRINQVWTKGVAIMLGGLSAMACNRPLHAAEGLPVAKIDLPAPAEGETQRTAVFGAGCFWCVEAVFERLEGVISVESGYAGGTPESAKYDRVSAGATDHAEVVKIVYDPTKITYGQLLRVLFATHDPTTLNRQGPDWGRQYRSAVFYENEDQKRVAEAYIAQLREAGTFGDSPIVTTLEPLAVDRPYVSAEQYHQDFVAQNPNHPYVQAWVPAKLSKLEKTGEPLKAPPAEAAE